MARAQAMYPGIGGLSARAVAEASSSRMSNRTQWDIAISVPEVGRQIAIMPNNPDIYKQLQ
jgi:hypothetical protein